MMLIFGLEVISERLQKEALLFPFCQDFAVSIVIIHFSKQLALNASVKHRNHDGVNIINEYSTTCPFPA